MIPVNPKLAGQHEAYLLKQLTEFKSGARKGTVMNGMAAPLSPDDMKNLAAYFSGQKANPGKPADPAKLELGQSIYRGGNAKTGLPACAGCHGPAGAGIPVQFPRLSGQNVDYVVSQLNAFRAGDRANDSNKMMQMIAARMSDKEIAAVADYVSALK
jgi:cytochrome c553